MKTLLVLSALFCIGSIVIYQVDKKPKAYEVPAAIVNVDEYLPYPG